MTRFAKLAAFVAPVAATVLGLAAAPAAAAEGGIYTCAPNAPEGQVLTCVPLPEGTTVRQGGEPLEQADDAEQPIGQQLAPVAIAPPPYAPVPPPPPPGGYPVPLVDRKLEDRTHNWVVPTGNLVRKGDAEVTLHEFVYVDAAIGLTDNIELNFSTPILPAFGSAGLRVGLTPRSSPLRLVVGGSLWMPLMSDEGSPDLLFSGTATVAYQGERVNVHGSLSYMGATGADEDGGIGVTNVGATLKLGRKQALFAEYVQVIAGDSEQANRVAMTGVGLKFMGATTDVDVGFVFPQIEDDDGFVALPLISFSSRF